MAEPIAHRYGKDAVSVYRIEDDRLFACEVRMIVEGESFAASYSEGDNSLVVATDSMKNFVHRAALEFTGTGLEDFLTEVGERFLGRYGHVDAVHLDARQVAFARRQGLVLQRLYDDEAVAELVLGREGLRKIRSGLAGLHLIKLAGSSFAGFVRDEYTTLPETADRPLFVHLDVHWSHSDPARRAVPDQVRESLVATFADFTSDSIQHLVHEMGLQALGRFPEISEIAFTAENRLWDTVQQSQRATVYADARPPFGVIELTLAR